MPGVVATISQPRLGRQAGSQAGSQADRQAWRIDAVRTFASKARRIRELARGCAPLRQLLQVSSRWHKFDASSTRISTPRRLLSKVNSRGREFPNVSRISRFFRIFTLCALSVDAGYRQIRIFFGQNKRRINRVTDLCVHSMTHVEWIMNFANRWNYSRFCMKKVD